jgi:hypothetical protein
MESQCLIDITNFINNRIISTIFLNIFTFLVHCDVYFFWHKYIQMSHHIGLKNVVLKKFDLWVQPHY